MSKTISYAELVGLTKAVHCAVKRWVCSDGADIDPSDLCGGCAIASVALAETLRSKGYRPVIVEYEFDTYGCHCWVEVNGYIADPTSGQFTGFKPFYVVRKENYDVVAGRRGTELRGKLAENSICKWSTGQNPKRYKKKIASLVRVLSERDA